MKTEKEIFFHVGLGKTASTYLQYQVFPKIKGLHYIQRTQYRHAKQIIADSTHHKFLVSNECDNQLAYEVEDFASVYPNTKAIIVLRRHDSWIASQYRRFIKNGRPHSFREFMDIEKNQGAWKKEWIYFFPKIQAIEKHFTYKPLVLFHNELKSNPKNFIRQIIDFLEVDLDLDKISLNPVHKSYNEKQLKAMRSISRYTYSGEVENPPSRFLKYLRHYGYIAPLRYATLYGALLLPGGLFDKKPLVPLEELEAIQTFYQEDWEKCQQYARVNNTVSPS